MAQAAAAEAHGRELESPDGHHIRAGDGKDGPTEVEIVSSFTLRGGGGCGIAATNGHNLTARAHAVIEVCERDGSGLEQERGDGRLYLCMQLAGSLIDRSKATNSRLEPNVDSQAGDPKRH